MQQYQAPAFLMKPYTPDSMRQVLIAKLKLQTTPAQFRALRQTRLAHRDALNDISRYACERGRMSNTLSNKVSLQDGTYQEIRAHFVLPAQKACSAPRQVGATYKALWIRAKANAEAHQAGERNRGLDQPAKYVSPTLTYQLGHDYSFKTEQRLRLLALDGRVVFPLQRRREARRPHLARRV